MDEVPLYKIAGDGSSGRHGDIKTVDIRRYRPGRVTQIIDSVPRNGAHRARAGARKRDAAFVDRAGDIRISYKVANGVASDRGGGRCTLNSINRITADLSISDRARCGRPADDVVADRLSRCRRLAGQNASEASPRAGTLDGDRAHLVIRHVVGAATQSQNSEHRCRARSDRTRVDHDGGRAIQTADRVTDNRSDIEDAGRRAAGSAADLNTRKGREPGSNG